MNEVRTATKGFVTNVPNPAHYDALGVTVKVGSYFTASIEP